MALNSLGHAWTTQIGPTQEFDAQGNNLASNPLTATGIAIDGAGNPWVATSNGINKINPITGSGSPFPGNNNSATTAGPVAIDQAGNVWSASIVTGNLVELSSSGNELTEFPVVPPPSTPSALAIDANGTLWVTSNDGFLRAATPNGTLTQQIQLGGAPQNIAIDQIGNLWVTDHQNNVVDEISTAGTVLGNFAVGNAPTAVAVDQSGSVYVANGLDGTISVLDAAGNITSTIPVNPLANTTASTQPIALGIDASGNIWVLDASFNSVHVVDKAAKGPQFFPYRGPQYPWGSGLSSD
jgi:streptogramin lyase